MARSKIIKEFISSNMDIDTALQNLMAILYCLDDENLINWVEKELSGYDIEEKLPRYRLIQGRVMANFFVGYMQYTKHQFPVNHLDEKIRNDLVETPVYSSISALIDMINKDSDMAKPISPEYYSVIQGDSNAKITSAYVDINILEVLDIVSKVKTKILQTLLFLEKEFGNLDELDIDISTKNEYEIREIVQRIQVNLYDNSITIGDGNKIKDTKIVTNK